MFGPFFVTVNEVLLSRLPFYCKKNNKERMKEMLVKNFSFSIGVFVLGRRPKKSLYSFVFVQGLAFCCRQITSKLL
jgi:hypothetical protein